MNVRIQTYGTLWTASRPLPLPTDKNRSSLMPHFTREGAIRDMSAANTKNTEGTTATAALEKGLQDLEDLCDVVSEEFWTARDKFNASQT